MVPLHGILIGTGILWTLNAFIVIPIVNYLLQNKLKSIGYTQLNEEREISEKQGEISKIVNGYYILVDTIVLGIAGFLFGLLLGWFFLGISFKAKGWPGLIAFISMSILGSYLRG